MRAVFDTNVLLSAIYSPGLCEALLDKFIDSREHFLYVSDFILHEFVAQSVTKFKVDRPDAEHAASFLRTQTRWVQPAAIPANSCRDPDDISILGTALAAKADCLVTGDKDLLVLGQFQKIPILSPRGLYEKIR